MTTTAQFVLLVNGPDDESYDAPAVFGPFASVQDATDFAERFRTANKLPAEATSTNNEQWTDAGWYFGIEELSAQVVVWA